MVKLKRTPLEKIQTLKSKDIAKIFFIDYLTPGIVTKILYKKTYERCKQKTQKGFVMPYVRDCFNEWKKEGFIETSPVKIPFLVKRKSGKHHELKNYGYRLNFEPLYFYCKKKYNIDFTNEEKEIINKRVGWVFIRKQILREYPDDDIINATIKYYLKYYGFLPLEILNKKDKKILEVVEKIAEKEAKEAEEFLKRKKKKSKLSSKDKELVNVEKAICNAIMKEVCDDYIKTKPSLNELKRRGNFLCLLRYVTSYKKNPELISNINKKLKKALGIGF